MPLQKQVTSRNDLVGGWKPSVFEGALVGSPPGCAFSWTNCPQVRNEQGGRS